jgi:hypothetical protein
MRAESGGFTKPKKFCGKAFRKACRRRFEAQNAQIEPTDSLWRRLRRPRPAAYTNPASEILAAF